VIVPTGPAGVGGYGEAPPKEPQQDRDRPPPVCNEGEEDETELGELICLPQHRGPMCSGVCAGSGVNCPGGMRHDATKALGLLYKCCNCKGDQQCHYKYDDGTECVWRPETKLFKCP
jgi:hypothetical protein